MAEPRPYALVAEFATAEALLEAVRKARAAGFETLEAYSPFPVEGVAEALGLRERWIAPLTLAGGVLGAAVAYGLQVWVNLDYPLNIGGRPLLPPQTFALITFELLVLFAVLACIGSMLWLNRLPRLHHPIFDTPDFDLATADRFFLAVFAQDRKFDPGATRRFLRGLGSQAVVETPLEGPAP